ncbi:Tellurium resistance, partial [Streptomyces sp. TRM76130]|nr:Tellurium resistance [Streptomyces sp. TRM76130]
MGILDGRLWRGRETDFDSGNAATNAIELTKRHSQVSLTKQGAATGHLRINLAWRMRTSDFTGPQRESLFRHPLRALKPPEVLGHSQSMVNVDLDLGCLYEMQDGAKGVVQPLGGLYGDVNAAPYVKLSG